MRGIAAGSSAVATPLDADAEAGIFFLGATVEGGRCALGGDSYGILVLEETVVPVEEIVLMVVLDAAVVNSVGGGCGGGGVRLMGRICKIATFQSTLLHKHEKHNSLKITTSKKSEIDTFLSIVMALLKHSS